MSLKKNKTTRLKIVSQNSGTQQEITTQPSVRRLPCIFYPPLLPHKEQPSPFKCKCSNNEKVHTPVECHLFGCQLC